jgi:hypothetical protein
MHWFFSLLLCAPALASEITEAEKLTYGNAALRAWLQQIDADAPYLLVDRARAQVQLMHGRAILRTCPLQRDDLGALPAFSDTLAARLRRYRSLDPWSRPRPGPFDWEQSLVEAAPDDGALYFSSATLLYASDKWRRRRGPAMRVDVLDLRALFNACSEGTPLIVLPDGWNGQ